MNGTFRKSSDKMITFLKVTTKRHKASGVCEISPPRSAGGSRGVPTNDLLYEEELSLEQITKSKIEITSVEEKLDELISGAIANAATDLIITNAIIEKREIEILSKIIKSKIK
jgi:hypothetical protein